MFDPDQPLPNFRRWLVMKGTVAVLALLVLLDGAFGFLGAASPVKLCVGALVLVFWARTTFPEYRQFRTQQQSGPQNRR